MTKRTRIQFGSYKIPISAADAHTKVKDTRCIMGLKWLFGYLFNENMQKNDERNEERKEDPRLQNQKVRFMGWCLLQKAIYSAFNSVVILTGFVRLSSSRSVHLFPHSDLFVIIEAHVAMLFPRSLSRFARTTPKIFCCFPNSEHIHFEQTGTRRKKKKPKQQQWSSAYLFGFWRFIVLFRCLFFRYVFFLFSLQFYSL